MFSCQECGHKAPPDSTQCLSCGGHDIDTAPPNVTRELLSESRQCFGERYIFSGRPAIPGKLTSTQEKMLSKFQGYRLGAVSKALRYARPFSSLGKRDHRALISLLKGEVLDVYRVRGSLVDAEHGRDVTSEVGRDRQHHYWLLATS